MWRGHRARHQGRPRDARGALHHVEAMADLRGRRQGRASDPAVAVRLGSRLLRPVPDPLPGRAQVRGPVGAVSSGLALRRRVRGGAQQHAHARDVGGHGVARGQEAGAVDRHLQLPGAADL